MNPVKKYHKRYLSAKKSLGISGDRDSLLKLIESNPSGLNNYFMAAMGMSTLMLRLGAVIQMCQKLERLDDDGDALFMKQILDNLRETLPSDTSWKNLWLASAEQEEWTKPVTRSKKEDYGLLILKDPIGEMTGHFGLSVIPPDLTHYLVFLSWHYQLIMKFLVITVTTKIF